MFRASVPQFRIEGQFTDRGLRSDELILDSASDRWYTRCNVLQKRYTERHAKGETTMARRRKSVTIKDVAEATGINRMTLSKIANHKGYSTVTDNLDKLCAYFECEISDLVEYVDD